MTRAAEHYPVSTREIKHLARLLRRADISVRKHRYPHHGFDVADRVVLGVALIKICARAPMHGQSLNATGRCDPGDGHRVAVLAIPTGADLERYGDGYSAHDRLENATHQRLTLQQRGAAELSADFLGRAAHVEVDDLCAEVHVDARRLCQLARVGARELHDTRLGLALVTHA